VSKKEALKVTRKRGIETPTYPKIDLDQKMAKDLKRSMASKGFTDNVSSVSGRRISRKLGMNLSTSVGVQTGRQLYGAADIAYLDSKNLFPELSQENIDLSILTQAGAHGEANKNINDLMHFFDKIHPLFGVCVDFHATSVIGKFSFTGVPDKNVLNFYENWSEEVRLFRRLLEMFREYFLLGEVYPFGSWDENQGVFDDIVMIDPNSIYITDHYLLGDEYDYIEYEPDEELKALINKALMDREFAYLLDGLDSQVIEAARKGKRIRLSSFNIEQLARKCSPYERRGTPIGMRCIKDLLLEEKYRAANYVIANRHIIPIMVWKLGDQNLLPTKRDVEDFRDMLTAVSKLENPNIVTHYAVNGEPLGVTGRTLPLAPEFERIRETILTAFFINEAVLRGEGPSFSGAPSIALRALNHMYNNVRAMVEEFLYYKFFLPIARAQNFFVEQKQANSRNGIRTKVLAKCNNCQYFVTRGQKRGSTVRCPMARNGDNSKTCGRFISADKKYLVPELDWIGKLSLIEDRDQKDFLLRLHQDIGLPVSILARAFNIDYDEWKQGLINEKGSYFDPALKDQLGSPAGGGGLGGGGLGGLGLDEGLAGEGGGGELGDLGTEGEPSEAGGEATAKKAIAKKLGVAEDTAIVRELYNVLKKKYAGRKVIGEYGSFGIDTRSGYKLPLNKIKGKLV